MESSHGLWVRLLLIIVTATSGLHPLEGGVLPDPVLEALVRRHLDLASGDITTAEMAELTELTDEGSNGSIRDLTGLGHALNLKELHLSNLEQVHVSIPGQLTKLRKLSLANCQVNSISIPGELIELSELHLPGNGLQEVTISANLAGLEVISLEKNRLKEFILPRGLGRLRVLNLDANQIETLWITHENNLSALSAKENQLSQLHWPMLSHSVREIDLSDNLLNDFVLPPVREGFTYELETLKLADNRLQRFTVDDIARKLTWLELQRNQLSEIPCLIEMPALRTLNLESNPLVDFEFLACYPQLTHLYLGTPNLETYSLPSTTYDLRLLQISGTDVADFEFLSEHSGLRNLRIALTSANVGSLRHLPETLGSLGLEGSEVEHLDLPGSLRDLWLLDTGDSQIQTIRLPANTQVRLIEGGDTLRRIESPSVEISDRIRILSGDGRVAIVTTEVGLSGPPRMQVWHNQGRIELSWADPSAQLQTTDELGRPWRDIADTANRAYSVPAVDPMRFFRLVPRE